MQRWSPFHLRVVRSPATHWLARRAIPIVCHRIRQDVCRFKPSGRFPRRNISVQHVMSASVIEMVFACSNLAERPTLPDLRNTVLPDVVWDVHRVDHVHDVGVVPVRLTAWTSREGNRMIGLYTLSQLYGGREVATFAANTAPYGLPSAVLAGKGTIARRAM